MILGHGRPRRGDILEVSVKATGNGRGTNPATVPGRIPIQRALTVSIVSLAPALGTSVVKNPYQWQIKGRPAFSKAPPAPSP